MPDHVRSRDFVKALRINIEDHIIRWPDISWVFTYWNDKRGNRLAPSWRDIDLPEWPALIIPRVMVFDVPGDQITLSVRFWGSNFVDIYGVEATNQLIRHENPYEFMTVCWKQCHEVLADNTPKLYILKGSFLSLRTPYAIVLRLPLSSNGKSIDGILCVEEYRNHSEDMNDFFDAVG